MANEKEINANEELDINDKEMNVTGGKIDDAATPPVPLRQCLDCLLIFPNVKDKTCPSCGSANTRTY